MSYPTQTLVLVRDPNVSKTTDLDLASETDWITSWLVIWWRDVSIRVISSAKNEPDHGDIIASAFDVTNERYETLEPEGNHPITPLNILKFFDERKQKNGEPFYPSCDVAIVVMREDYVQSFPKDLMLKLFNLNGREVDLTKGQPTADGYGWVIHLDQPPVPQGIRAALKGG